MTSHDSLAGHLKTEFQLTYHHKYSITDLESRIPWQRFVLIDLIENDIKEEARRKSEAANAQRDIMSALNVNRQHR